MDIKFKKLHPDAVLPSYAKENDGALDLTAVSEGVLVSEGEKGTDKFFYYVEYDTGLGAEVPPGYVGLMFPRSSISKKDLFLANSVGVLDAGFRSNLRFRFKVDGTFSYLSEVNAYKKGDRIGQLMVLPRPTINPVWAEELSDSERGQGGFGSTN
jgi:dUTP pyrophosphatase